MSQATDFFNATVKPTVAEFLADIKSIRHGCLAAIVLNHMADYVALGNSPGRPIDGQRERLAALRNELIAACPEFSFINDIADASKHAQLHIRADKPRDVSNSLQITSSSGAGQAPFGEAVFAEAAYVYVVLEDGTEKPLAPAIRAILALWEARLPSASLAVDKLALAVQQMRNAPNILTDANFAAEAEIEGQIVSGAESGIAP